MRTDFRNRFARPGVLIFCAVAALAACDVTADNRPQGSSEEPLSSGTATVVTMLARADGMFGLGSYTRPASVMLRGGRAHVVRDKTDPSAVPLYVQRAARIPQATGFAVAHPIKHLKHRVIADGLSRGKRITILAVRPAEAEAHRLPDATITLVDGALSAVSELRFKAVAGKTVLVGATTTAYDKHGKPALVTVETYSDGRGTSRRLGATAGRGALVLALTEAAVDALLPAKLLAQGGVGDPCGVLYTIMIQAGANAANARADAIDAESLCQLTIVEDPEAALILCPLADIALMEAEVAYNEALMAQADYLMCMADNIQVLPEVVIVGTPPKDCYDYDVWVSDPDNEDMGWWETWNSCDAED